MSIPIIEVQNLSKLYHLGVRERLNKTFRETLTEAISTPIRNFRSLNRLTHADEGGNDTIWALKDVSFQVYPGEVVGIIGRNGAGKSTLLKIMSRITEPTQGEIRLRGRISSLLEVGTGFHPELTGRENIYLNGTILGMRKAEIDRRFDEIVSFSEIERFLDTPVKRYSSGMYVRLAFAVAAHLEPEILLVDEVLAVGDSAFQKKCLGKIGDVARKGRTILFVSHNMAAVQSLCSRSLLLHAGGLQFDGVTGDAISHYRAGVASLAQVPIMERTDRTGNGPLRFTGVTLESDQGEPIHEWPCGHAGYVVLSYESGAAADISNIDIGFSVASSTGQPLFQCFTKLMPDWQQAVPPQGKIRCFIPSLAIKPGVYFMNLYAEKGNVASDWIPEAAQLHVGQSDYFGSGRLPEHSSFMLIAQQWKIG